MGSWAARCAGAMRAGVWWLVVAGRTPSARFAAVRASIAGQAAPARRKARVWLSVAGLPLPARNQPDSGECKQREGGRLRSGSEASEPHSVSNTSRRANCPGIA